MESPSSATLMEMWSERTDVEYEMNGSLHHTQPRIRGSAQNISGLLRSDHVCLSFIKPGCDHGPLPPVEDVADTICILIRC